MGADEKWERQQAGMGGFQCPKVFRFHRPTLSTIRKGKKGACSVGRKPGDGAAPGSLSEAAPGVVLHAQVFHMLLSVWRAPLLSGSQRHRLQPGRNCQALSEPGPGLPGLPEADGPIVSPGASS